MGGSLISKMTVDGLNIDATVISGELNRNTARLTKDDTIMYLGSFHFSTMNSNILAIETNGLQISQQIMYSRLKVNNIELTPSENELYVFGY